VKETEADPEVVMESVSPLVKVKLAVYPAL
jgi:hypothetical protein